MYPGHELVGRNRWALVDAQQLRLVTQAFENNLRPPKDHESMPRYRQMLQTVLEDTFLDPSLRRLQLHPRLADKNLFDCVGHQEITTRMLLRQIKFTTIYIKRP